MSIDLTWKDVEAAAELLAARHLDAGSVWGVPRGGVPVAVLVASQLGVPLLEDPVPGCLVVDDLVDSGRTLGGFVGPADALFRKPHSPGHLAPDAVTVHDWVVFPWERGEGPAEDNVIRLLEYLGEDPTREGLVDTPRRVVAALAEMTEGRHADPAALLSTVFTDDCDEMVVVSGIPFQSLCEHHLLPFTGHATVAYIPDGQVVGLSKLPRLVQAFARRLQLQEQLTRQVADTIETVLDPLGVGVILTAHHTCMSHRGVRSAGQMTTSAMLGEMRESAPRSELLALHNGGPR